MEVLHCTSLDCDLCDYEYCPNEHRDSDGLEDFDIDAED